jgi:hypothetical protein
MSQLARWLWVLQEDIIWKQACQGINNVDLATPTSSTGCCANSQEGKSQPSKTWSVRLMSTHASVLVDSVGPPSAEVCRTAASFP